MAAWVYWAIMWPRVDAGVVGEERRQPVVAGLVEQAVGAALADATPRRRRRWRGSRARSRPGRRGSCRCDSTRPSASTTGLSTAAAQLAAGDRGGVRRGCRGRRRAPAGRSAASRRPGPGCSRPAVRGHDRRSRPASSRMLAADAAWPGCGRRACRSAAKTRSVPSSASTLIAAAMSAVSSRRAQVGDGQHQHAEHAVGAVDERQALLRGAARPARCPAAASASAAAAASPSASRTSPSPISARAQCASGARSPEQPSEPYSCTTGVMPALSRAASVSAVSGRTPVWPVARVRQAQQHQRARRPRARPRGPSPAACERTSERCSWARSCWRDVPGGERAEPGRDAVHRGREPRRGRRRLRGPWRSLRAPRRRAGRPRRCAPRPRRRSKVRGPRPTTTSCHADHSTRATDVAEAPRA